MSQPEKKAAPPASYLEYKERVKNNLYEVFTTLKPYYDQCELPEMQVQTIALKLINLDDDRCFSRIADKLLAISSSLISSAKDPTIHASLAHELIDRASLLIDLGQFFYWQAQFGVRVSPY